MHALYSTATALYHFGIRCAAPWNAKAKAWIDGREGIWERLEAKRDALRGCLWMHCASVGEFEQGRPVLEAIKAQRPDLPVLITFFSPSGYEARKLLGSARSDSLVTHVEYLPPDSAANAERLVSLIAPRAAIFIKYEFWFHHLHALKAKGVPVFLVSAIFREGQPFFKWYGGAWRSMLGCYARIFTQDEHSRDLLARIDVKNAIVSGDTRFDRVSAIAEANEELSAAGSFRDASDGPVLICGSTWPKDDEVILGAIERLRVKPRVIIAPHEPRETQLQAIERSFPKPLITWSEAEAAPNTSSRFAISTLLVDRTGLLARLYKYGDIAYVGGGFTDGIHSILEAAAWGRPVIFGPKHVKFVEAKGLIDAGAAWEVKNAEELHAVLDRLIGDPAALKKASEAAARFVRERVGATARTVEEVLRCMV